MDYLRALNELNEVSLELARTYNKYFYNIENPEDEMGAKNVQYYKNEFFTKKLVFDVKVSALSKFLDERFKLKTDAEAIK